MISCHGTEKHLSELIISFKEVYDTFYLIVSNYEDAQRQFVLLNVSWIKLSVLEVILKALSDPADLTV